MRGPIIYCLEGVDRPAADVLNLVSHCEATLGAAYRPEMLGGVPVLEGQALADGKRPTKLTAVPYNAWANRDKGAMTVWIDEAPPPGLLHPGRTGPTQDKKEANQGLQTFWTRIG